MIQDATASGLPPSTDLNVTVVLTSETGAPVNVAGA
jgi:hypothetical protein